MCGLVHKYVRKTTPEFTVEKLYNSQAGTVLPMERLDFIIADKNTAGSFGDCHCVWGYVSVQAPELHRNPAGWDHWVNGVVLDSSVS